MTTGFGLAEGAAEEASAPSTTPEHEPGVLLETRRSWSFYRSRAHGDVVRQSTVSLAIHSVALGLSIVWLLAHRSSAFDDWVIGAAVLVTTAWLVVGPTLVVAWERKVRHLAESRRQECSPANAAQPALGRIVRRLEQVLPVFIAVPVLVMTAAYFGGDRFVDEHLALRSSQPAYYVGYLVIVIGSVAGGWGLWGAAKTLALGMTIARQRCDFAPFAGVTSRSGHSLARFCFWSALTFGLGGAVLLPGICVMAWQTDGVARGALFVVIGWISVTTAVLLALPAWALSQQYELERTAWLDEIAVKIDALSTTVRDHHQQFTSDHYTRLRGLLELREHVVSHTMPQSSLEMVKRIPLAVLLPVSSTAAAWLSIVAA